MPERIAFRMNLNPGQAAEYEKRHDEIFPELTAGAEATQASPTTRSGSIPRTNHLFGILTRTDDHTMAELPEHRDHEALVEAHGRHHGDGPRQCAGAGAAQARVLPAVSSAFRIKDLRVYTMAPKAKAGTYFKPGD